MEAETRYRASEESAVDGYSEPSTAPEENSKAPTVTYRDGRVVEPRACRYPSCGKIFTPTNPRYDGSRFCCPAHKTAFWTLAGRIGERILADREAQQPPPAFAQMEGRTHNEKVLNFLRSLRGAEVEDPASRFPGVVWHSRIADLRKLGHRITCRRAGSPGSCHYFYRLLVEE